MQVRITPEEIKKEIERILKERFGVENIGWDDDGSAVVDTELDKILKEQKNPQKDPWIIQPYKNPTPITPGFPSIQPYTWPKQIGPYLTNPATTTNGTLTQNGGIFSTTLSNAKKSLASTANANGV